MRANCHLNGFSHLYSHNQRLKTTLSCWAETQAHIPLHATLKSPILSARHHFFRKTGLASRPCAPEARFSNPSQLKD
ncbi:hypothetical protein [Escherichia fergusonii]|uniref:protein YnhH n=1 Tax=Escherichia fergusonii TaxID=564 RepID=UPI003BEEEA0A